MGTMVLESWGMRKAYEEIVGASVSLRIQAVIYNEFGADHWRISRSGGSFRSVLCYP